MWAVRAEAHDGQVYTLGIFPNRRTADGFKIVAKRWKRFWVEPTPARGQVEEVRHEAKT